jgi:hypothetical protein
MVDRVFICDSLAFLQEVPGDGILQGPMDCIDAKFHQLAAGESSPAGRLRAKACRHGC